MREESSTGGHRGLIPALVVIALGLVFLMGNLGVDPGFFGQGHWWAWFIMLAAVSPLAGAVQRYRRVGMVDAVVWQSLLSVAVVVMIASMFLLQLAWAQWWPVFVVYGGLRMLSHDPWHAVEVAD